MVFGINYVSHGHWHDMADDLQCKPRLVKYSFSPSVSRVRRSGRDKV